MCHVVLPQQQRKGWSIYSIDHCPAGRVLAKHHIETKMLGQRIGHCSPAVSSAPMYKKKEERIIIMGE